MRNQSDRPKQLSSGETGWIHVKDGATRTATRPPPKVEKPRINAALMIRKWRERTQLCKLHYLSLSLGLSGEAGPAFSMEACLTEQNIWAFPMKDGYGNYLGIRLRHPDGKKWSVPGSRSGIFLPKPVCRKVDACYIVEGPTDTMAALDLGLYAIGRPSCSGGAQQILEAVRFRSIPKVVIVADCDGPGISGAENLQQFLPVTSCVITLPAKDMREFVSSGGTRELLESITSKAVWRKR